MAVSYPTASMPKTQLLKNINPFGFHILIFTTPFLKSQQKVFDMFYRGTSTANGSGLGLYICKEMLEKMNARYSISSTPGKGTSFSIIFPKKNLQGAKEASRSTNSSINQSELQLKDSLNKFSGFQSLNQAG